LPDHDRPLNKRGKNDAPRMGKLLRKENLIPDVIISFTAIRAYATAKAVSKACEKASFQTQKKKRCWRW